MIAQGWLYAGAFAAGVLVAGTAQEWRWNATYNDAMATVAKDAKDRAQAVVLALNAAGEKVQVAEAAISQQREDNAKTTEAQAAELDRLNRCLKSGTCGLRVAAKCPAAGPVQQAGNDSAGRDSQAGARLDPAAESDYLEFRRLYKQQLDTLKICKTYGESQIKKPSL